MCRDIDGCRKTRRSTPTFGVELRGPSLTFIERARHFEGAGPGMLAPLGATMWCIYSTFARVSAGAGLAQPKVRIEMR